MPAEAGLRVPRLPIRRRLRRMSMASAGAALALACAAFILFDIVSFNDAMLRNLSTHAEVIATNVAPALLFKDPEAAAQTLAALRAKGSIRLAAIYDADNRLFARYQRDPGPAAPQPPETLAGDRSDDVSLSAVRLVRPVMAGQQRAGSVYVESDLSELWLRLRIYLAIAAVVLAIALLLALAVAGSLAEGISRPILALVETARLIASGRDYGRRAAEVGGDEIGELAQSFNAMLDQLEKREANLQRINRELEDFARVASHDLQEPLRKIQSFGERLRERHAASLDAQASDYVGRMMESAGRMRALVEDLLNFSRAASPVRVFRDVDLNAVLADVLSDLQVRIEGAGARVDVGTLPTIEADGTQMYQLFLNLLSNALKFRRPEVPLLVSIRAQLTQDSPPGHCQVVVEDNGIGFEQKYAERIFSVFRRLHARQDYEGTGMGLAICRKIVDQHNGTIEALGRPGEGARFIVTLPVRQRKGGMT